MPVPVRAHAHDGDAGMHDLEEGRVGGGSSVMRNLQHLSGEERNLVTQEVSLVGLLCVTRKEHSAPSYDDPQNQRVIVRV